ncbi:MAG: hypothetical protein K0R99_407 [Microbacterium sp.]|jgi:hypothetical protein|uniref:SRPBCC family protein n=1 Tax=Microbacterium sp. TaxID=51671 RepID=UPI00262058E0|nr:Clp protease N-terminal domain-containing protein [Microbacterium sp.]MDF2558961.1 hypothetical protein [Microbacterium sp.]
MSRFIQAAATMHTLSLAAMEEASRFGIRDADIDHLLLALTIDPGTGGQVLRGMGVGLEETRMAVAAQHAAQLDLVGIASDTDDPGRIVFHETSGYEWTARAIAVIKEASRGDRRGDSAAVLRTLLDEPSGLIEQILQRLDVDQDALRSRLDELRQLDLTPPSASDVPALSGARTVFIPAGLDDVWALLSSAGRIPEWDQGVTDVRAAEADGWWDALTRTITPDGRRIQVKDDFRRQRIECVRCDEPHDVAWRFTRPDAPRANPRRIDFGLEHAAGGTQLRITVAWEPAARRRGRRIVRALLKPVHRFFLFIQLTQIESGITRVFR